MVGRKGGESAEVVGWLQEVDAEIVGEKMMKEVCNGVRWFLAQLGCCVVWVQ